MDLSHLRNEIDAIDKELVKLFCARMNLSAQVADYKKAKDLPIYHPQREREILEIVGSLAGSDLEDYTRELYTEIFRRSRKYQSFRNGEVV